MQRTSPRSIRGVSRGARAGLAVLAVLAVAGCGGTPAADEAVASAVAAFDAASSGHFVHSLEVDGSSLIRTEGDFDLDAGVSSSVMTVDVDDEVLESATVVVGNQRFTQPDTSAGPCWLVEKVAPALLVPAPVEMALNAEAYTWITEGGTAMGATSLRAVLESLGALGAEAPTISTLNDRQIDAKVHLEDGDLVAVSATMETVVAALSRNGAEAPPALEPFGAEGLDIPVLVGFSDLGKDVSASAPDPTLVVESKDALKKCNARAVK